MAFSCRVVECFLIGIVLFAQESETFVPYLGKVSSTNSRRGTLKEIPSEQRKNENTLQTNPRGTAIYSSYLDSLGPHKDEDDNDDDEWEYVYVYEDEDDEIPPNESLNPNIASSNGSYLDNLNEKKQQQSSDLNSSKSSGNPPNVMDVSANFNPASSNESNSSPANGKNSMESASTEAPGITESSLQGPNPLEPRPPKVTPPKSLLIKNLKPKVNKPGWAQKLARTVRMAGGIKKKTPPSVTPEASNSISSPRNDNLSPPSLSPPLPVSQDKAKVIEPPISTPAPNTPVEPAEASPAFFYSMEENSTPSPEPQPEIDGLDDKGSNAYGMNSNVPSMSSYFNSRTMPKMSKEAWKPKKQSMLMKKAWSPKSSSTSGFRPGASYLEQMSAKKQSDSEPQWQKVQRDVESKGQRKDDTPSVSVPLPSQSVPPPPVAPPAISNTPYLDSSPKLTPKSLEPLQPKQTTTSSVPSEPTSRGADAPKPVPNSPQPWNAPDTWTSAKTGAALFGGMQKSGPKPQMKQPWQPARSKSSSKTSFAGVPAMSSSSAYLASMNQQKLSDKDPPSKQQEDLQPQPNILQENEKQPTPPPAIPSSSSSSSSNIETPETTSSPDSTAETSLTPQTTYNMPTSRSSSYLDNISPPPVPKDKTSSSADENIVRGVPPFTPASAYLKSMSPPSKRKEPWSPKSKSSQKSGVVPPFASTTSYLDSMGEEKPMSKDDDSEKSELKPEPQALDASPPSQPQTPSEEPDSLPVSKGDMKETETDEETSRMFLDTMGDWDGDWDDEDDIVESENAIEISSDDDSKKSGQARFGVDETSESALSQSEVKDNEKSLSPDISEDAIWASAINDDNKLSSEQISKDEPQLIKDGSTEVESLGQSEEAPDLPKSKESAKPSEDIPVRKSSSYLDNISPSSSKDAPNYSAFSKGSSKWKSSSKSTSYLDSISPKSSSDEDDEASKGKPGHKSLDGEPPKIARSTSYLDSISPSPSSMKPKPKSSDADIPPFARVSNFLENLSKTGGSSKDSGDSTRAGKDEILDDDDDGDEDISAFSYEEKMGDGDEEYVEDFPSFFDLNFPSFEEGPLQITEEFVSITKANVSSIIETSNATDSATTKQIPKMTLPDIVAANDSITIADAFALLSRLEDDDPESEGESEFSNLESKEIEDFKTELNETDSALYEISSSSNASTFIDDEANANITATLVKTEARDDSTMLELISLPAQEEKFNVSDVLLGKKEKGKSKPKGDISAIDATDTKSDTSKNATESSSTDIPSLLDDEGTENTFDDSLTHEQERSSSSVESSEANVESSKQNITEFASDENFLGTGMPLEDDKSLLSKKEMNLTEVKTENAEISRENDKSLLSKKDSVNVIQSKTEKDTNFTEVSAATKKKLTEVPATEKKKSKKPKKNLQPANYTSQVDKLSSETDYKAGDVEEPSSVQPVEVTSKSSQRDKLDANDILEESRPAADFEILASTSDLSPSNATVLDEIDEVEEYDLEEPSDVDEIVEEKIDEYDLEFMSKAIEIVNSVGGELHEFSAYPKPTYGALLVSKDGEVLGSGVSDYKSDAVVTTLEKAGLGIKALPDWVVSYPNTSLQEKIASATLYLTLEPSTEKRGASRSSIAELIKETKIPRVVIGAPHPAPEREGKGAAILADSGIDVSIGLVMRSECDELIPEYTDLSRSKLRRMGRYHMENYGRPLGLLHCSVVASDNIEAFARHGNAFGTAFGGKFLSFRNLGAYELAPPPDIIWADTEEESDGLEDVDDDSFFEIDFEEEDYEGDMEAGQPVMPWYEQADAVVATFPRSGHGPLEDDSVTARLSGLKWLATQGNMLPAGVERILVMDATDLEDLPLTNDDPNLPPGVDVESFWEAKGRKPTRVILRKGGSVTARAAAARAAASAAAAAKAAEAAMTAIESGDAVKAAVFAIQHQKAAQAEAEKIEVELERFQAAKRYLDSKGVIVETIENREPIDVMKYLGESSGLHTVVWRAGCWGERGAEAIMAGAFQWVSAHLAVDAMGGKFWQLMVAENAIQAACGPQSQIKVFADEDDISLEYCDLPDADSDCALAIDGRPVRHVRVDCRVAVVDANRRREFSLAKTKPLDQKILDEEAPWFL